MILTVTLNPAIDMTYEVDALTPGAVHRVTRVEERPGGKSVNVARVLHALGERVVALGPGDEHFETLLAHFGVEAEFPHLLPQVRRTVAVVTADATTSLQEPGWPTTPDAADRLEQLVAGRLVGVSVLVISGSLAPGLPHDLPTRLAALAHAAGVATILDLDDEPLAAAVAAGGSVLMPNRDELERLLGTVSSLPGAVLDLSARTGAPVIATLGADGLIAAAGGACWRAEPVEPVAGNPTGAGDATAAGVAIGLARGLGWPELLAQAVALGAAAVAAAVAGEIDHEAYRRWVTQVAVHRLDPINQES